jgi:hypothetical protein
VNKYIEPNGKKHFYQHRWDGSKWVLGVVGTYAEKPIPYRLPELKAALQADLGLEIHIAEGEKDTDTLAGLGFIATTNPGGAAHWTDDLTAWLRILGARRAVIHQDNDEAGAARTAKLIAALSSFISLRVVTYPDVPAGEDVTWWLEGHTRDDLVARIAAAQPPPRDGYVAQRASTIEIKPISWIWLGHLARGHLELLTGIPGAGKSQIHCAEIACTTTGGVWPDGCNSIAVGNVIMLTAEDSSNQTVVPRLRAAGADLDRVHILRRIRKDNRERMFLLHEDLTELERMIANIGDVLLVTVDPITAYMGGKVDSHRATDVRNQLGPLSELTERCNVAISCITHPAKHTSQRAIDQFIGSQAFIAAARIGHMAVAEMEEDAETGERQPTGRMLLTNAKNNLYAKMPTLAYRIELKPVEDAITAPYIVWEEIVDLTADQAVAASTPAKGRELSGPVVFLQDILTSGPVLVSAIEERGTARGFSKDQLTRAKKKLGVVTFHEAKVQGRWFWALPQHALPPEQKSPETT